MDSNVGTEETDEEKNDWDGSLFAYRGYSMIYHWEGKSDEHEMYLVPTPDAPERPPDKCQTSVGDLELQNLTCRVDRLPSWFDINDAGHNVNYTCQGRGRLPWFDGEEPDAYRASWILIVAWEEGPVPDDNEMAFSNWSAWVEDENGTATGRWDGAWSPCYSYLHSDSLVPPFVSILDWTWNASAHGAPPAEPNLGSSFRTSYDYCLLVMVNATVDRYGYYLRLVQGDGVIWELEEPFDPERPGPEEMHPVIYATTEYAHDSAHSIEVDHGSLIPPPSGEGQTTLRIQVIGINGYPCEAESLDQMR